MKIYLKRGTTIILKPIELVRNGRRNAPMVVEVIEKMLPYFGKMATIRYMDTDDTFNIEEDGGRFWYDTAWIGIMKQRSE